MLSNPHSRSANERSKYGESSRMSGSQRSEKYRQRYVCSAWSRKRKNVRGRRSEIRSNWRSSERYSVGRRNSARRSFTVQRKERTVAHGGPPLLLPIRTMCADAGYPRMMATTRAVQLSRARKSASAGSRPNSRETLHANARRRVLAILRQADGYLVGPST